MRTLHDAGPGHGAATLEAPSRRGAPRRGPAAADVAAWLLRRGVLAGGGVVSWWADARAWHSCYPEIAGYYLQFLAYLGADVAGAPARADVAARVVGWLDRIAADGPPRTHYHRRPVAGGWQNAL